MGLIPSDRYPLWILIFFVSFASAGFLSLAQESVIEGTVVDGQGNPLKNVKIVFTDKSLGNKFSVKSNKEGRFMRVGIPPGQYIISIEQDAYYPLNSEFTVDTSGNKGVKLIFEKAQAKVEQDPGIAEGTRFFQAGQFEEAIAAFQRVIDRSPDNVDANYGLALSLLRTGQLDEAIGYLEKVKELKPDLLEVYLGLGESYFKKGQNDRALSHFDKALKLQPGNAEAYYNIGIIYYKNNETEKAIQNFLTSKSIKPEFAVAYYQLALAHIKQGQMAEAVENLEKYLELQPDSTLADQVKALIAQIKK